MRFCHRSARLPQLISSLFSAEKIQILILFLSRKNQDFSLLSLSFIIYSTIVKLTSSSTNFSSFTTSLNIVSISTKFISTYNLIRITYYLYSFVTNINNIAISREVVIIINYIASNYSRSKIKSIRVNVVKSLFSTY